MPDGTREGDSDAAGPTLKPRQLLRGEITYEEAKDKEVNILHQLGYWDQKLKFFTHLYANRRVIRKVVAHHLGLGSVDRCHLVDVEDWIHGSFNVCIRADVDGEGGNPGTQVMIRLPLPYRIGEKVCPGNADEKVRCEVGTYAWLQENCPEFPIPRLYGFGLSTGQAFTVIEKLPLMARLVQRLRRRILKWLGYPVPTSYVQHPLRDQTTLGTPYILIEYIDSSRGTMLVETWKEGREKPELRKNLFHGLSRMILTLARIPLPRIGSFVLDEKGYLQLSNRPLTMDVQQLPNEHIPVDMPRDRTYDTVESYISDLIELHESRLRHQPNGILDEEDGLYQTSALMVLRSVWPCFFRRDLRRGPFFLSLTDLHQPNIFVDDEWNITCLIDLEWAHSAPVEMIHPPHWFTQQAVDQVDEEEYGSLHKEFMEAFVKEEENIRPAVRLSPILQEGWDKGTFWVSLALSSPTGLFAIFYKHIQRRFAKSHSHPDFWRITMPYWNLNCYQFIKQRAKEKELYDVALRKAFEA